MRKVHGNAREIVGEPGDALAFLLFLWMAVAFEKQCELCLMHLEAVHLLVIERVATDDRFGREELAAVLPKARIRGERPMLGDPRTDRALRNVEVETAANDLLRFGEGVAEIERGDRVEDGLKRIGLVFACCSCREVMQAF